MNCFLSNLLWHLLLVPSFISEIIFTYSSRQFPIILLSRERVDYLNAKDIVNYLRSHEKWMRSLRMLRHIEIERICNPTDTLTAIQWEEEYGAFLANEWLLHCNT